MIHFFCTCGQPMSVKPEFIGRTGQCPRCKQPITVPAQSQRGHPPPSGGHPPPPPPQSPQSTQPYHRGHAPPPPSHRQPPPSHRQPPPQQQQQQTSRVRPARLEVAHGPAGLVGKTYTIDGTRTAVIGRDPQVEVSVPSDRVSRRHCQLVPGPAGFVIQDLGSSNGTLINQIRLNGSQPIKDGDYIQTGDCLFRFVAG